MSGPNDLSLKVIIVFFIFLVSRLRKEEKGDPGYSFESDSRSQSGDKQQQAVGECSESMRKTENGWTNSGTEAKGENANAGPEMDC